MLRALLPTIAALGLVLLPGSGGTATITTLKSLKLDVPTSDAMFPAGPGSDAINNNCLACHNDHRCDGRSAELNRASCRQPSEVSSIYA